MKIFSDYSLQKHNTFRIEAKAKFYVEVKSEEDIKELIDKKILQNKSVLILGEGANILLTRDFDGIVIKISIKGIKVVSIDNESVVLDVGAGENWHEFVKYCIDHKYAGVENLIYIPGTVGAAPAQNIAAYGQNFSDVFVSLEAIDTKNGKHLRFLKDQCEFTYRDSIFKSKYPNRYIITKVRIKLSKESKINTSYFETGKTYAKNVSLEEELSKIAKPPYSVSDVGQAVLNIRKKKLPDIRDIGTAGSFFKNPVVTRKRYEELKADDPDLQCYPVNKLSYPKLDDPSLTHDDYVKIPAARLLDNLGWKGKRMGNVGIYPNQALAVVNYGASGREILDFTKAMEADIYKNYKIRLEREVIII